MAKKSNFYTFRLKNGYKPVSWTLPMKNEMAKRKDKNGNDRLKSLEYIPGHESYFKEDHKGDEKAVIPTFEYGVLKVRKDNTVLYDLLTKAHSGFNRLFDLVDKEADAIKELDFSTKVRKAMSLVNGATEEEIKATGIVLIGYSMMNYGEKYVRAKLDNLAMKDPDKVIKEMKDGDYKSKYIAALAFLNEIVETNAGATSVRWADNHQDIVRVAVGENPFHKFATFLADSDEKSKVTLQEISERVGKKIKTETKTTETTSDSTEDYSDLTLEEARYQYEGKFERQVANAKKNDLEWIISKLQEPEITED